MNRKQFGYRYFLTITVLFLLFVGCFVVYQHRREKTYNIELLNCRLQGINRNIIRDSEDKSGGIDINRAIRVARNEAAEDNGVRITLISNKGTVLYDSSDSDYASYENHLRRKEVSEALAKGSGYDIIRHSKSLGDKYFYSATLSDDSTLIVRCAVAYNTDLTHALRSDNNYLLFAGIITIMLLVVFFRITRNVSRSISEKENLLSHLRISREGLGVFDSGRNLILANTLFNQYGNMISDSNLSKTEDILQFPELAPIRDFLDKELHKTHDESEQEPCISYSIDKNGSIYMINSVVFQDGSFEISINDITLQAAQSKLKHELTQNIAHELKTPVSSIQGYLEIIINSLGNEPLPPEKMRYFIERCYTQSTRLTNLLQDISTLSRMGDTSRTVDKERLDISQMVTTLIQEVTLRLDEQQMKIDNLLPQTLMINGNQSMVYSIFRNLFDNAISYAGKGTTITINCFNKDDKYLYFSFADNGIGVPEEHLNRIFERFYRVDKGRSRKLGGTGLGLAIVKNAIAVHGGSISVKSRPGGGLEFIFSLKIQ